MSKNKFHPIWALVLAMVLLLLFIFLVIVIWEQAPRLCQWCKKKRGKSRSVGMDDQSGILENSQTSLEEINRARQGHRVVTPYINPAFWDRMEYQDERRANTASSDNSIRSTSPLQPSLHAHRLRGNEEV
ncbi:uncharacterized protein LOC144356502 [Saccoglossus kowalevskii]